MTALFAFYTRVTTPHWRSWYAIPLRLIVGYGFMEHGYAKLVHGPESFTAILHALGMPAPALLAWTTILVELLGGSGRLALDRVLLRRFGATDG
jgi:putative oxidoreductase